MLLQKHVYLAWPTRTALEGSPPLLGAIFAPAALHIPEASQWIGGPPGCACWSLCGGNRQPQSPQEASRNHVEGPCYRGVHAAAVWIGDSGQAASGRERRRRRQLAARSCPRGAALPGELLCECCCCSLLQPAPDLPCGPLWRVQQLPAKTAACTNATPHPQPLPPCSQRVALLPQVNYTFTLPYTARVQQPAISYPVAFWRDAKAGRVRMDTYGSTQVLIAKQARRRSGCLVTRQACRALCQCCLHLPGPCSHCWCCRRRRFSCACPPRLAGWLAVPGLAAGQDL